MERAEGPALAARWELGSCLTPPHFVGGKTILINDWILKADDLIRIWQTGLEKKQNRYSDL